MSTSPSTLSPCKSTGSPLFVWRPIPLIYPALTVHSRSTDAIGQDDPRYSTDAQTPDLMQCPLDFTSMPSEDKTSQPTEPDEPSVIMLNTTTDSAPYSSSPPLPQELTVQTAGIQSDTSRADEDDPQSVIHAPPGFSDFRAGDSPQESTISSAQGSDVTVQTLKVPNNADKLSTSPVSPPPLTTKVTPWSDRATPRAQTRQEVDTFGRKSRPNSLEDIPENLDHDSTQEETEDESENANIPVANAAMDGNEINALKTALSECWTLCNTLANLSSIHRERLFTGSGKANMQEQAWKSCWKLCRNLYENRDNDDTFQVRPTLDLCREFCQALFEIRIRDNEVADSILRVSFELNNHLYNTHDRNLPEAFRERTLDFYITLCHRLMKQRTQLAGETDSLLRACWGLAEMLFSLRQSRREGKLADEELLGSAVQACWDLCDLFREGWTQVRPDRRTPRPSQTSFTQAFYRAKEVEYLDPPEIPQPMPNPETPTTIFDDTATTLSPDQAQVPNILVLGAGNTQSLHPNWTSTSSSTLTGYSRPSSRSSTTSSTHTVKSPADDPNLTCLKLLIVRAAMNNGFQRGGAHTLPSFVKALSSDAFGTLPWQTSLLMNYKKLVTIDPAFTVVPAPACATAPDIARAVQVMIQHNGQYSWLLDLYRLVFGFRTDEAIHGSSVAIQT
ncbi:hypothetical protein PRK78_005629 [Emydomyces testavorans]|uniref:DUF7624 domain-containing protein n=1 Tax=Emydomyces testavorans TaxID=2070801 RepID=A0AAF0DJX8_9EURO|nr:hypothetical protein PRK78_005629 [Emydomyces testavorans]